MDIYQERYLAHRERKEKILAGEGSTESIVVGKNTLGTIASRVSQRTFNDEEISPGDLEIIYESIQLAPSSCNRQAILIKPIIFEVDRRDLENLLVGGEGWLADAKIILLLFADMAAYKSPAEVAFMPYLDAGVVIENVYLAATILRIGTCYVNPNIRDADKAAFSQWFNPRGLRFCGAMALGRYDTRTIKALKRQTDEIFY